MAAVSARLEHGVGEIVLDRPAALNSLDHAMVTEMLATLREWSTDDDVHAVVVRSAHDRAFCAGGDIRAVREAALNGRIDDVRAFFETEYALDLLIATYAKPYVAVIDGVAMGGGLGISVHGDHRVVTENALFAMPETAIGFFPDVGASWFLPRLDGAIGRWLALTGARLRGAQCVESGLATHLVPARTMDALIDDLRTGGDVDALLTTAAVSYDPTLPRAMIDTCFSGGTVADVMDRLRASDDPTAAEALTLMSAASPTSLLVTDRLLELGAQSSLRDTLDRELAAAVRISQTPDFAEGIRAVLIDKDRAPRFEPERLEDVDAAEIERILGA